MTGGRFVEEQGPGNLGDLGDAVLVDGLHVFCADTDQHHPDGTRVAYPSVVLSFSGDSMVGDERTVRIVLPVDQWPVVNRIVRQAVADEAAGADEPDDDPTDTRTKEERHLDADWEQLCCDLIEVIEVLEPGQFLILSASGNRFVQIFVDEDDARVETVSNQFLAPEHHLSFEVLDLMEDLGWNRPTHFASAGPLPEGASPNHFMELEDGWDAEEVAPLMTNTLRYIHRIHEPCDVGYVAGSVDGDTLLFPLLGLRRLRE